MSARRHRSSGGRPYSSYDESDVKIRPGRTSRPRTKKRPAYENAIRARIVTVDRGRWGCVTLEESPVSPAGTSLMCVRARILGKERMVVGDIVDVVGDLSGTPDTLARIVRLHPRFSVLRRTADDTDPYERIVVANAEQLLIVVAAADPPPREGFVQRALIAAYAAGIRPLLCITKTDIADPSDFIALFEGLSLPVIRCGTEDSTAELLPYLQDHVTAMIGHSGVGKSTLTNRLNPDAHRTTGQVSAIGKGRHTSTQFMAMELPEGGWIIDSPGIRSFGLAHVTPETVVEACEDLTEISASCPRGCTHRGLPYDTECAWDDALQDDTVPATTRRRITAVRELLIALTSNDSWALGIEQD